MKRVYLFCNAGMSTSLVASKMQKVANEHNLPIEVKAFSDAKMASIVEEFHPDVILLGPQVKFKYEETKQKYESQGILVEVIDLVEYGNVDGERILKRAIKLLKGGK
ncbi:PTS sugar transporter subunit IIB [Oceanivirga salmonicida]|uniref:PTS sugar transporter subunit IIB n=1 Tax=Oceanivirga salmonicida TaxID=1769291 RepID=UPI0008301FC6|nr:PTS sugar transporter subunit IIB [Oceanivirga salmonicida]